MQAASVVAPQHVHLKNHPYFALSIKENYATFVHIFNTQIIVPIAHARRGVNLYMKAPLVVTGHPTCASGDSWRGLELLRQDPSPTY